MILGRGGDGNSREIAPYVHLHSQEIFFPGDIGEQYSAPVRPPFKYRLLTFPGKPGTTVYSTP